MSETDADDAEIVVRFPTGEALVMIAALANGVAQLTVAIAALTRGDTDTAVVSCARAGEAVDRVFATFNEKFGADLVDGE